jgi:hypothetical protein
LFNTGVDAKSFSASSWARLELVSGRTKKVEQSAPFGFSQLQVQLTLGRLASRKALELGFLVPCVTVFTCCSVFHLCKLSIRQDFLSVVSYVNDVL